MFATIEHTWRQFNASINGHLVIPRPAASPCHEPNYDEYECRQVKENWTNGYWRADQPGALQNPNWEILPNETWGCPLNISSASPCKQGNIPVYAVDARSAEDVQKAVMFASTHNLRLVVKSTGHDYIGRSTAAGALSIWTHHLKNIDLHDNFVPVNATSNNGTIAVTLQSGVEMIDLYRAVGDKNWVVVGGTGTSIAAAGGYVGGGGHSPLSPRFGLAVDNCLQFTVVLASGELIVANDVQNTDLFWALRGGGASTWGVVIDVTFRTYIGPKVITVATFGNFGTFNMSTTIALMGKFVEAQLQLANDGWTGYSYVSNDTFFFGYIGLDLNQTSAEKSMGTFINSTKEIDPTIPYNYMELPGWFPSDCGNVSCPSVTGAASYQASRLIPESNFERPQELIDTLKNLMTDPDNESHGFMGQMIAGGEVSKKDPGSVAVHPAWRKALWHVVLSTPVNMNSTASEREHIRKRLTKTNRWLRNATPGSGSYMNEADSEEPDWQQAFFGSHYDALKKIKNKVDPQHLFICTHCVGSDDWDESLNCRVN
ncbi:hypothetical protein Unana1_07268 [Umbelopsis nana]